MARFFNTAGPCRPDLHYMVDPLRRIERLRRLIDRQSYFVVHGPRQTGKTMSLLSLAAALVQEGRYAAALLSLEVGRAFPEDVGAAESAILQSFRDDAPSSSRPTSARRPGLTGRRATASPTRSLPGRRPVRARSCSFSTRSTRSPAPRCSPR
ncbi:hypothetical protein WMF20_43050 [Sorangium sp. So ce834]